MSTKEQNQTATKNKQKKNNSQKNNNQNHQKQERPANRSNEQNDEAGKSAVYGQSEEERETPNRGTM